MAAGWGKVKNTLLRPKLRSGLQAVSVLIILGILGILMMYTTNTQVPVTRLRYPQNRNSFYSDQKEICQYFVQPIKVDMRMGTWQAQKVTTSTDRDDMVFVIHSYYDDRPRLHGNHFLRLFLVMQTKSWQVLRKKAFCYLWTEGSSHPVITTSVFKRLDIRRFESVVNNRTYNSILMSCPIPIKLKYRISHISFNTINCSGELTSYLPVTYIKQQDTFTHTFGQCIANGMSYGFMGDKQARWMVEWIEMNRLFGITEFNLYNGTMQVSANYQKVLEFYQDKGILRLYHQVPPVVNLDPTQLFTAKIAKRTGYNDCLYRNMYRYQYIVSIDLDEIIVPAGNYTNYTHILQQLDLKNVATIKIGKQRYPQKILNQGQNVSHKFDLVTTKFIREVSEGRTKHFFNPRLCLAGRTHGCMENLDNAKNINAKHTSRLAKLNHYREECGNCQEKWESMTENRNIYRFATSHFYKQVQSIWNQLDI